MLLVGNVFAIAQIANPKARAPKNQKQRTEQTHKQKPQKKTEQKRGTSSNVNNKTSTRPKEQDFEIPSSYNVSFSCNVSSATMYIDGIKYGVSTGTYYLLTGKHTVKLIAKDYEDFSRTIFVDKSNTRFVFEMTRNKQSSYSTPLSSSRIKTFYAGDVSFDMVWVDGGNFLMGSNDDDSNAYSDRKPQHSVTLSGFYIGKCEVTQELWQTVMGNNPSRFKDGAHLPVEQVSWNDCQVFIRKLNQLTGKNFRLPTEAEWEYAARGGRQSNGYLYSGYYSLGDVAWCYEYSNDHTHPVGMKLPNELELYDLCGNVSEWCQDWYSNYNSNSQTDPNGPISGTYRVFRGGSWVDHAESCSVTHRYNCNPSSTHSFLGLRLAM